jgi:hypothetical protein
MNFMLSTCHRPRRAARLALAAGLAGAALLTAAACGSSADSDQPMSGMSHPAAHSTASAGPMGSGMPGMGDMPTGDGLGATASGLTFAPSTTTPLVGQPATFRFQIRGADGAPVTAFEPDQTKLMHFYLIRSDLTGFQHVHPTMAADGTWTANLATAPAGSYRAYASFINRISGRDTPLVLSRPVTVPGPAAPAVPLPAPSRVTTVDGYTLTVAAGTRLMGGMTHPLTLAVSRNGTPVNDLEPYLDTYAHLTAFHEGDLSFAHLHPLGAVHGDQGGPTLSFEAMLPHSGRWRLFVQFQTAGVLHTAALTLAVS